MYTHIAMPKKSGKTATSPLPEPVPMIPRATIVSHNTLHHDFSSVVDLLQVTDCAYGDTVRKYAGPMNRNPTPERNRPLTISH